jgi:hypothetical protein
MTIIHKTANGREDVSLILRLMASEERVLGRTLGHMRRIMEKIAYIHIYIHTRIHTHILIHYKHNGTESFLRS